MQTQFPDIETQNQDVYRSLKVRIRYYVPILSWAPTYRLNDLRDDIVAGCTVAFLIIPQSLSYAQGLVGIPPMLGLTSAFIPQFIYGILGTSKYLELI
jgi:MFS superfamily sulfate permease-like transporter